MITKTNIICQINYMQDHGLLFNEYKTYGTNESLPWTSARHNVTRQQLFDLVTYTFEEVVAWAALKGAKNYKGKSCVIYADHDADWIDQNTYQTCLVEKFFEVTEQRNTKYGKCWTLVLKNEYILEGVRKLTFKMQVSDICY